jgi:hypothetical protein
MHAIELRRAAETAPASALPTVNQAIWAAMAAGSISEDEAGELSQLVHARRALRANVVALRPRRGARPRSPVSIERRRRWAAAGYLPPPLAARFTPGEQAALAVVAVQVLRGGDCRLAVGHVAALAGVGETTVRTALRQARALGLVTVEERRHRGARSDTNIVRVVAPDWRGWLDRRGRRAGGGWVRKRESHEDSRTCTKKEAPLMAGPRARSDRAGGISPRRSNRARADRYSPPAGGDE